MKNREKAIAWWNTLTFEHKFYKVIEWLKSQDRDTTERHPNSLTGREIEEIYELDQLPNDADTGDLLLATD